MGTPSEPLLPVDPAPPPRRALRIAIGAGAGAAALGLAAVLLLRRGDPPPAAEAPAATADPAAARAAKTEPGRRSAEERRAEDPEERRARERYEAAEAFERAEPGDLEKRMARWREVVSQHPASAWGKKADDRYRAAATALQTFLDREFEGVRRDAQTLAAAGHYGDAIETLRTYRSTQARDLLKRRAEVEITAHENACRLAYNEAATKARELAIRGDFAAAVSLVESVAGGAIPEVAERCRKSAAELRAAAAARDQFEQARKGDDARKAFREDVAPKILGLVRARRYDD